MFKLASALVVASVSARQQLDMDAKAPADWVAGFIYGMTEDNQLTEIEACFNDSDQIVKDFATLAEDLKDHKWIDAAKVGKEAYTSLKSALAECQDVKADLTRIDEWAQIFTHPVKLAETAGVNYVKHHKQINSDFKSQKELWNNAQYFQGGENFADAMTLLLGQVPTLKELQGAPVKSAALFLEGFIKEFATEAALQNVEQCVKGAKVDIQDVEAVISDIKKGDFISAVQRVKSLITEIKDEIATCKEVKGDIADVEKWAAIFTDANLLAKTIVMNVFQNKDWVESKAKDLSTDVKEKHWQVAGTDTAELVLKLVPYTAPTELDAPETFLF